MASRVADLRDRNPLPEGTVVVGAGLAVTGAASYGYLVISAPVLGPAQSGSLSVLWALVFMIGGIFLPFEQEVSRRLVGRRVAGLGARSIARRALVLGAGLVGILIVVTAALAPTLTDRLFSGEGLLVVALMLGAAGLLVANWTQGVLSGSGRFERYGSYLGGESLVRLTICVVLLPSACAPPGRSASPSEPPRCWWRYRPCGGGEISRWTNPRSPGVSWPPGWASCWPPRSWPRS